jgi:hypothetical protein
MDITALYPSERPETMPEPVKLCLRVRIGFGQCRQHSNAWHALGLLRARRERPRRGSTAEKSDELTPLHRAGPMPKE